MSKIKDVIYTVFTLFKNSIEMEPIRSFLLIIISMIIGYAFDPIPNFFKYFLSSNVVRVLILILTGCIYNYPLKFDSFLWIIFFSISIQVILEIFRDYDTLKNYKL